MAVTFTFLKLFILFSLNSSFGSTILPQNNINCSIKLNEFIPSISQLLKGVGNNCDVRILMDGVQEFQFNNDDYKWPTTTILVSKYYKFSAQVWRPNNFPFAIDILKTRIQSCVVNLIFVNNPSILHLTTQMQENGFRQNFMSVYFTFAYYIWLQYNSNWCTHK